VGGGRAGDLFLSATAIHGRRLAEVLRNAGEDLSGKICRSRYQFERISSLALY